MQTLAVGSIVAIHAAAGVAALLLAIAMPAEQGPMLIIPIEKTNLATTVDWVGETGAAIVALGPTAGSIVVYGKRDRLLGPALHHASLLLTAPPSLCGAASKDRVQP